MKASIVYTWSDGDRWYTDIIGGFPDFDTARDFCEKYIDQYARENYGRQFESTIVDAETYDYTAAEYLAAHEIEEDEDE